MDYKDFLNKIFNSVEIKNVSENEFIVVLPSMYRFAENKTRFSVLVKENTLLLNDRGKTLEYLEYCFVDVEKYEDAINNICETYNIRLKNNIFEKEIPQTQDMERDFFNFVQVMHLIANINALDNKEEF